MPPLFKNRICPLAALAACALAAPAFALSLTINNGGTVNLGNRTFASVTITNGTALNNTGTPITGVLTFGGSSNNWTGALDLQANKMIVQPTANKAAALAALQNQTAFGATHATGILSTALPPNMGIAILDNAVTNFITFGSQSANANSLLLSPELLGDANADGTVNLTDLDTVLNNFGDATPNWTDGNFDYAPTIDLTDLSDVLNNFNLTNSVPSIAANSLLQTPTPTPEPSSLLLILFPTLLLHPRRRRPL